MVIAATDLVAGDVVSDGDSEYTVLYAFHIDVHGYAVQVVDTNMQTHYYTSLDTVRAESN